jgi:hypothetical protein
MSQSQHQCSGFNFGIRIPQTTKEAIEIDREDNSQDWHNAIMKEMANGRVALKLQDRGTAPPPGYKKIPLTMIFDIKMEFTKKARLVAGAHRTTPLTSMTYSSVVSRESVRIAFLIAALNDLDVIMSDVANAYLNAKITEKVYGIAGIKLGDADIGKICVVVRALYGLKTSGAAWRAHFTADLRDMGFSSTLADPDVWYHSATKGVWSSSASWYTCPWNSRVASDKSSISMTPCSSFSVSVLKSRRQPFLATIESYTIISSYPVVSNVAASAHLCIA